MWICFQAGVQFFFFLEISTVHVQVFELLGDGLLWTGIELDQLVFLFRDIRNDFVGS